MTCRSYNVSIIGSSFTGNINSAISSFGGGGAIYAQCCNKLSTLCTGSVSIERSIFSNNSAGGRGGAAFFMDCDVSISDNSVFQNNSAGQHGGALSFAAGHSHQELNISDTNFLDNVVKDIKDDIKEGYGGALGVLFTKWDADANAFIGSVTATVTNSKFLRNKRTWDGKMVDESYGAGDIEY